MSAGEFNPNEGKSQRLYSDRELSDTVLFNGSLKELNSLNKKKQHRIISGNNFVVSCKIQTFIDYENIEKHLKTTIINENFDATTYDGLINAQRLPPYKNSEGQDVYSAVGVPVVRCSNFWERFF